MSDENERPVASAGSVAERPLGDPEIAVGILKQRVAELEQAIRRLADAGGRAMPPASDGSAVQRDVSADARQWLDERSGIVQTHHYGCHMQKGHEACLVERLLGRLAWAERERDSLRVAVENLAVYARTITLTDAEREAIRGLLERTK